MQITTILPTYKRPLLLKRAIESVLNQTYSDFKLCIYDNASNDETKEVVLNYQKKDSRVDFFCHQENIGLVNNFLFGLKNVITPYFSFLSDDDLLLPWFYEEAIKNLKEHPKAQFYAGSTISCLPNGEVCKVPLSFWPKEGLYDPYEGLLLMATGRHPTWTGILFKTELINKIGYLDPLVGNSIDLDFQLKAAQYPFLISKKPSAIFLCHPGSCSSTRATQFIKDWQKLISNQNSQPHIPQEIKAKVIDSLSKVLVEALETHFIYFLKKKAFENCQIILEELAKNLEKEKLNAYARKFKFVKQFPQCYLLFNSLKNFKKLLKKPFKFLKKNKRKENYSEWLKNDCS